MEANEEITQKLKSSICNYFMGYIKQKLNYLFTNEQDTEIVSQITQFLDAQIDTQNFNITRDDIIKILYSILLDENENQEILKSQIDASLPLISDIVIESNSAAYVTEKQESPFGEINENTYYLYVSPEYYQNNIQAVENEIKNLEKDFSKQDLKGFEEKYKTDFNEKQYELETARVYESAKTEIKLKKQKFNSVCQKMINEYGKKYNEINEKDISEEEKANLKSKLLNETKSYEEKNNQAILRLNAEYENLVKNFDPNIQSVKEIENQMRNLHLFDKDRYLEDMKASIKPELGKLYKDRYLLNSYRREHNEIVYSGKKNVFSNILDNIRNHIRGDKAPLMLGPHFERDYSKFGKDDTLADNIDKDLIKALAKFYASKLISYNMPDFEACLVEYFKNHFEELNRK